MCAIDLTCFEYETNVPSYNLTLNGEVMSNIIDAIINLLKHPELELHTNVIGKNRVNNLGYAFEDYIKNLFAGTSDCDNAQEKLDKFAQTFSYLGNDSNPPDVMLRNGDAIEVKKIETCNSSLALNSSYPKHKLYANSNMISKACREAEDWSQKDIIYTVGIIKQNRLSSFCMVYGLDYCASSETYERVRNSIKEGIKLIPNIKLMPTNELGRVNNVDPLGITYLRMRGMWGIENPFQVFKYVFERDFTKSFNFMAIINFDKYNSFNNTEKLEQMVAINSKLSISDIKIKNPDNPAQLKKAKLISIIM